MGGTFLSLPSSYRDFFVRGLHDALSGHTSTSVAEAVRYGEQSRTKCIGLTIETRPDFCQACPAAATAARRVSGPAVARRTSAEIRCRGGQKRQLERQRWILHRICDCAMPARRFPTSRRCSRTAARASRWACRVSTRTSHATPIAGTPSALCAQRLRSPRTRDSRSSRTSCRTCPTLAGSATSSRSANFSRALRCGAAPLIALV